MKIIRLIKSHLDSIFLFIFCLGFFKYLTLFVRTDIIGHLKIIEAINANKISYPPNFLYYLVVNSMSGFSSIRNVEILISIVILSIATVSKFIISKKVIIELNQDFIQKYKFSKISIISLALFFCFAIPDPYSVFVLEKFYLGRYVPIVWHNSTTIVLFPFAILLFWRQLRVFNESYISTNREILILNMLVIANIIIKPSFIFVYAPVTFIFILKKIRRISLKNLLPEFTPILTGVLIIITQYYLIYKLEVGILKGDSDVAIGSPFKVITRYIPMWYVPVTFLMSFLLPLSICFIYKEILKYKPFLYALSLTITGLLISTFIYETGPRMFHGNFYWQVFISTFLLFLSTVSFLIPKIFDYNKIDLKVILVSGLLLLHSLSGILYIFKIGFTKSFI